MNLSDLPSPRVLPGPVAVGALRDVLGGLPLLVFGFDRDGVCTLSEGGLLTAFGFEPGENVGRSVTDFVDRFPELISAFGKVLGGEPVVGYLTVPGHDHPFEVRWQPTIDDAGEVSGVVALVAAKDTTAPAPVLETVRREYRTLLSAFPDHVLRIHDGDLVTVKPPAESAAVPPVSWIPRPVDELWPRHAVDDLRDAVAEVFDGASECTFEFSSRSLQPGDRFEARVMRETIASCLVVVRDITTRFQLQNELREASKLEALGRLAAGVAHEINTPIQFVAHNVEFMGRSFESMHQLLLTYRRALHSEDPRPWFERAETLQQEEKLHDVDFLLSEVPPAVRETLEGMERVSTIVRAMRMFSHPAARELAAVDLNEVVRNSVVVTGSLHRSVATVELDLDDGLPAVRCVGGEISQVLLNLIVNAAQAIEETVDQDGPGVITIRTSSDGEQVVVSVADDGPGIAPGDVDRVFEPFFTTKEVGQGTGQGLSLARTIVVTKHGGQLTVASTPGRGATFEMRLPIAGPPASHDAVSGATDG